MALAKGLKVDLNQFFAAIDGEPLDLPYLRIQAASILHGDATLNFSVDVALKDARLIVEAGEQAGVRMDVAAACVERFRRASSQGHGGEDYMTATYFASFDA